MRTRFANWLVRGLIAPGLAVMMTASVAAAELPKDQDQVVDYIRTAIETRDYDMLKDLVFWKDTGKIKKRIVRFHLSRSLGRPIRSIGFEDFPHDAFDEVKAGGRYAPNMDITHAVRVVFDEPPTESSGKPPTAVFLLGKRADVFRIALVNRAFDDDDDD